MGDDEFPNFDEKPAVRRGAAEEVGTALFVAQRGFLSLGHLTSKQSLPSKLRSVLETAGWAATEGMDGKSISLLLACHAPLRSGLCPSLTVSSVTFCVLNRPIGHRRGAECR